MGDNLNDPTSGQSTLSSVAKVFVNALLVALAGGLITAIAFAFCFYYLGCQGWCVSAGLCVPEKPVVSASCGRLQGNVVTLCSGPAGYSWTSPDGSVEISLQDIKDISGAGARAHLTLREVGVPSRPHAYADKERITLHSGRYITVLRISAKRGTVDLDVGLLVAR